MHSKLNGFVLVKFLRFDVDILLAW